MKRRDALRAGAASVLGILSGCRFTSSEAEITDLSSPEARALISTLAEIILPETDTPGAKAAGVDKFIIRALNDCHTARERAAFVQGLNEFQKQCRSRFGRPFLQCSASMQLALVEEADREPFGLWSRIKSRILRRTHFFRTLKRLTALGYFTSREATTGVVAYEQIPGRWTGCVELKTGQKTWASE